MDHIHLSVAIPPKISISNFMGYLKGKSTLMLYDRHPELQSKWDKAFWMIIPELSEPPVRTLGATIPENESRLFR